MAKVEVVVEALIALAMECAPVMTTMVSVVTTDTVTKKIGRWTMRWVKEDAGLVGQVVICRTLGRGNSPLFKKIGYGTQ